MLLVAYRNLFPRSAVDLAEVITPDDQRRFTSMNRRQRRELQRQTARALLADMLRTTVGWHASSWDLTWTDNGKPELVTGAPSERIHLSLSHSGPVAIAAITDLGKVGIDVEWRAPRGVLALAAYAFGPREQSIVKSGGLRAFYRLWTLREALSKVHGDGFPMLADGRDYFAEAPWSGSWSAVIDRSDWTFATGEIADNYSVSIAIAGRSGLAGTPGLTPRYFP